MAGDPLQVVDGYASISEPGQCRMTKVVPSEVFVPKFRHYFVPVRRVAKYSCRDAAAARSGEDAGGLGAVGGIDSPLDKLTDIFDQRST